MSIMAAEADYKVVSLLNTAIWLYVRRSNVYKTKHLKLGNYSHLNHFKLCEVALKSFKSDWITFSLYFFIVGYTEDSAHCESI